MKTGDHVLIMLARESRPEDKMERVATLRLDPGQAFLDLTRDPLRNDTHHEISVEDLLPAVGRTKLAYRFTFYVPDEFWIAKQ